MTTLIYRSSVYGISFSKAALQAVCATVVIVAAFTVAYHLFPLIVLLSKATLIVAAFYALAYVAKLLPSSNPYGGLIVTNATPTITELVTLPTVTTKEVTELNKVIRAQFGKTAKVEAAIKKVRSLRSSGQSFTAPQYVAQIESMISN